MDARLLDTPAAPDSERSRLVDRTTELAALDGLLRRARKGRSGTLVLRGEPGIGKTALLDRAGHLATGMGVARLAGIASERDLALGAVQGLLARVSGDGIDAVRRPQRETFELGFSLEADVSPRRLTVGLTVLAVIREASEQRPLVCLVDDAQWLDGPSADALAFAARRVDGLRVAFIFAVREPSEARVPALEGLAELRIQALPESSAAELLAATSEGLAELVRRQILLGAHGNPLALLSLPSELTAEQSAGTASLAEPLRLSLELEASFMRPVAELPAQTRRALLVIAAEPDGDEQLVRRAATRLGIAPDALGPAESAGLVSVGPGIAFRHPLIRTAVYCSAPSDDRQRVHEALAAALELHADRDRRAFHHAAASLAPTEGVAAELERSAIRARERGGYAAEARQLERAARLTPDASVRVGRLLAAARAELVAGAPGRAAALLGEIVEPADAAQRAEAQRLRGAVDAERGIAGDTPGLLLRAARDLDHLEPELARSILLDGIMAAAFTGRFARGEVVSEIATEARSTPRRPDSRPTATVLLLDGIASLVLDGHRVAAGKLRRAADALRHAENPRLLGIGCFVAVELWDDELLYALATRRVGVARDTGALAELPRALNVLGVYEVAVGSFDAAEARLREASEIDSATGHSTYARPSAARLMVLAWRGQEAATRALAATTIREAAAQGQGLEVDVAQHALAVLEIGLGRYRAGLEAAQEALEPHSPLASSHALPELVEAASRAGELQVALVAADRLAESAEAAGTDWGLGLLARSQALVTDGPGAEGLYQEAITRLKRCRATSQLARARLVYGEWLRRHRRPRDAADELRTAHEFFSSMGAAAFAARAQTELFATGARPRLPSGEPTHQLTAQEDRIARLAADGASNREIAARLFISPRTVEYHLHKVFRKLGIGSRIELARNLVDGAA